MDRACRIGKPLHRARTDKIRPRETVRSSERAGSNPRDGTTLADSFKLLPVVVLEVLLRIERPQYQVAGSVMLHAVDRLLGQRVLLSHRDSNGGAKSVRLLPCCLEV